jgi:hypothetical protein
MTNTEKRTRRLTIHYPPVIERQIRNLSERSGIPLGRLKAEADALVSFPPAHEVWEAYVGKVGATGTKQGLILLEEGADDPTAEEFLDDLRDGEEGPAEGEDLELHDSFV